MGPVGEGNGRARTARICHGCAPSGIPMTTDTPLFNAWRTRAVRLLAPRGRKAELARHLSKQYGRPERSWERHISAITAGDREPKAELFLAISKWLDGL